MKALSRITALIIVAFAFVSSNAQDFEGVWYPSKDNNIGNIKIQKKDDGYSVRIKMDDDGIKTCKGRPKTVPACWQPPIFFRFRRKPPPS